MHQVEQHLDAMIRVATAENQHTLAGQLRKVAESVALLVMELDAAKHLLDQAKGATDATH